MIRKNTNAGGLTPEDVAQFRAMLLAKQKEILGNVMCMEDEALRKSRTELSNMPFHMADIGTDNFEMENTLGLMDSERRLLVEIEDALGRIQDGTYGVCEGNDEPIPKARLEAIPWARFCVKCAGLWEKGLLSRRESVDAVGDEDYMGGE